jgi:hypothetical protein
MHGAISLNQMTTHVSMKTMSRSRMVHENPSLTSTLEHLPLDYGNFYVSRMLGSQRQSLATKWQRRVLVTMQMQITFRIVAIRRPASQ